MMHTQWSNSACAHHITVIIRWAIGEYDKSKFKKKKQIGRNSQFKLINYYFFFGLENDETKDWSLTTTKSIKFSFPYQFY